jgi:hypothetical protein
VTRAAASTRNASTSTAKEAGAAATAAAPSISCHVGAAREAA